MKESPIIFNTQMVQSILGGSKTQTRRIMKLQINLVGNAKYGHSVFTPSGELEIRGKTESGVYGAWFRKPPYIIGDLLYVRETYFEGIYRRYYRADSGCIINDGIDWKWTPSIHMPKSAARIWLQITDIRVERVMDISNEDAIAEGIQKVHTHLYKNYLKDLNKDYYFSPLPSFRSLFKSIYGEQIWNQNPWVWVITFEVVSTTGKPATI